MIGSSWRYRAAHRSGAMENGAITAPDREAAVAALTARGLFPLEIAPVELRERSARRIPSSELAIGLRILATLLGSGLTLVRSLDALCEVAPPAWKTAIPVMRERIREGNSLASSMRESPARFPPVVLGILEAGESGSGLAAAVRAAADLTEREAATRMALRSALAYPALLASAGVASAAVLVTVVLPRFSAILADVGGRLPRSTQFLVSLSETAKAAFVPATILIAALCVAMRLWTSTESGRLTFHGALMRIPWLGEVRRASAAGRVSLAISALLRSGVPAANAFAHGARAGGDAAVAQQMLVARERIVAGERMSSALMASKALTPTTVRLLRAGEESGEVVAMLEHAATLESERAARAVASFVRLLEPALILAFGAMVAFVAAALLQAIYGIRAGV